MLKRIKVTPRGDYVLVTGYAHAARGAERVIGRTLVRLDNIKEAMELPEAWTAVGLDEAPSRKGPPISEGEST